MSVRKLRVLLLRLSSAPLVFLAIFVRPSWAVGSTEAVRMWSILYVGGRKSDELVTQGPYSLCRNPLYIGTFLLAIGAGLCFENLLMLVATLGVILPAHVIATRLEERHLGEKFPRENTQYKAGVPRFWPRLRGYRSGPTVTVSVRAIRRVTVDTLAVLLIPEMEDLLEVLHAHGIVPVLWYFP